MNKRQEKKHNHCDCEKVNEVESGVYNDEEILTELEDEELENEEEGE